MKIHLNADFRNVIERLTRRWNTLHIGSVVAREKWKELTSRQEYQDKYINRKTPSDAS
jgi:hypothetical protein